MSNRYAVEFERSAKKNLDRLDGPIRARVLRKVAALADDPWPHSDTTAVYGQLKADLARLDDRDRTAYRAGEAPFIRGVLDQLRQLPG